MTKQRQNQKRFTKTRAQTAACLTVRFVKEETMGVIVAIVLVCVVCNSIFNSFTPTIVIQTILLTVLYFERKFCGGLEDDHAAEKNERKDEVLSWECCGSW